MLVRSPSPEDSSHLTVHAIRDFRKDVLGELRKLKLCWPALDFAVRRAALKSGPVPSLNPKAFVCDQLEVFHTLRKSNDFHAETGDMAEHVKVSIPKHATSLGGDPSVSVDAFAVLRRPLPGFWPPNCGGGSAGTAGKGAGKFACSTAWASCALRLRASNAHAVSSLAFTSFSLSLSAA